jgi:hypothetical protein
VAPDPMVMCGMVDEYKHRQGSLEYGKLCEVRAWMRVPSKGKRFMAWTQIRVPKVGIKVQSIGIDKGSLK